MSDKCEVVFLDPAKRDMKKIAKQHPERIPLLEQAVTEVMENGWILSTRSKLIRVLRSDKQIGEIRDLGSGGYRLIFFWEDVPGARQIWVTAIPQKSEVQQRSRLNTFIQAAEKRRKKFLQEKERGGSNDQAP